MNSILAVFFTAFMAMFKIFLISCVGVACASYPKNDPLLNRDALRHFSRLNTFVLSPALVIYSLGSTLNMQLFIHLSLLFPFGITIILVSYIFGYLLKCIHEDNEVLYKSSLVCVGSPNGISLPIMVMASLCENSDVNADYDGDADQCFDEASSMMFIYIIPWFLFFWSYGYSTLSSIHDKAPAAEDSSNDDDKKTASVEEQKSIQEKYTIIADKLWLVLRNPALLGVYLGLFIGLIPGLGDFLFNKVTVLQPFGGAVEVLATPVVALNSLVMSASLAHINVNWADLFPWLITRRDKGGYEYQDSSHGAEDEGVNDQDLRMEVELEVMDISDVGITRSGCGQPRSRTSSKNSTDFSLGVLTCSAAHEEARAGAGTEVMGSGIHSLHTDILLGEEVKDREEQGDRSSSTCAIISANARHNDQYTETRSRHTVSFSTDSDLEEEQVTHHTIITDIPQFRSIVFIILCRLILCPLVLTFLVYISIQIGFIPAHLRLMQLLIVIEAAAPPAQMVIVVLNQLGFQNTASTVAYTYVFLYLLSILTITLWSTVAMILFY